MNLDMLISILDGLGQWSIERVITEPITRNGNVTCLISHLSNIAVLVVSNNFQIGKYSTFIKCIKYTVV